MFALFLKIVILNFLALLKSVMVKYVNPLPLLPIRLLAGVVILALFMMTAILSYLVLVTFVKEKYVNPLPLNLTAMMTISSNVRMDA
jgi:hypothetical protein